MYQYDPSDMILPDGFDPNAESQNLGETEETTPAEAPTTEQTAEAEPVVETKEETAEVPVSQSPTTGPEKQEEPAPIPTLKVRYNGQDRELKMEEAREYAQKGLNYDKVSARAEELGGRIAKYESMAKMFGFENAEAMMSQAEQNYINSKIEALVAENTPPAMAKFLVEQEMKSAKLEQTKKPEPEEPIHGLTAERRAELEEFNAAYPDVTKIPDEVFQMHTEGVRLKTAYGIYLRQQEQAQALEKITNQNKAAQEELAVLRQNQAAAAKGPVTGTVGKAPPKEEEKEDPFVTGFNFASRY